MSDNVRNILSKIATDIDAKIEAIHDLSQLAARKSETVLLSDQLDLVAEDTSMLARDLKYLLKYSFTPIDASDTKLVAVPPEK